MKIKIYLDDERTPPENWILTTNVQDTIDVLKKGIVSDISLDHDLGFETECGYDVLLWIEEQVHTNPDFVLPEIKIHTANPSARKKMELGLKNIKKYYEGKK